MNIETWVDDWIRANMRTRVLDGRPSKQFRDQLVKDITQLLASQVSAAQSKRKGKADE